MEELKNGWQIGERLYNLRNQSDYTQEELAERLDVSRQSVSKWELDKTLPDVEKLIQLSELYDVSLDYLVKGIERNIEEKDYPEESEESHRNLPEKKRSRRGIYTFLLVLTGLFLLVDVIFMLAIVRNHAFNPTDSKQEVIPVDRVIEQYTKAEVSFENDNGVIKKETVWLDTPGVRQDDYIFCYKKANGDILFRYYIKTLCLPLIVAVILMMYLVVFWMEWSEGKAREKK